MRHLTILLAAVLFSTSLSAQDIQQQVQQAMAGSIRTTEDRARDSLK